METINIKGKEYAPVNERLKEFRSNPAYTGWSLISEIVSHEKATDLTDYTIIIKASILDDFGRIRAMGLAYEKEGNSFINKTSYIENCETSAWGRALGNLGIGVETSVASYEEVGNAITQQEQPKEKPYVSSGELTRVLNKLNNKIKELHTAGKFTDAQSKSWQESIEHLSSVQIAKAKLDSLEKM